MIRALVRLEFQYIFPEEEEKNILLYLEKITPSILLNIIGFSTTYPQPNFDNFFTNMEIRREVSKRVIRYCQKYGIKEKPALISREASLTLSEIILSNRKILIEQNTNEDNIDRDELNLFKAFLVVNKRLNAKQKLTSSEENFDKIIDMSISMMFSTSDLGLFEEKNQEFGKLLYATIVKFEFLIEFLQSDEKYQYLIEGLCSYFGQKDIQSLLFQVKYLFAKLLEMKVNNGFKFQVDDTESLAFLNTLISKEIIEDEDFTNLKNFPLYKINDNTISIIDFFFAIDKFYKSVKFILKGLFNEHFNLENKSRRFFQFYNTEFSEQFLMKRVLDDIFDKKYYIKKSCSTNEKNEPDYYVRHNNLVFLFENKDVLINKKIKSSSDITKINRTLKSKFLETNNTPIGIGQLITSIIQIVEKKFEFDEYVNSKKNLTIFPILLINDRIFEILGINYRFNQWYLEDLKSKLRDKYNPDFLKQLTVIDIDTLIYWTPYFNSKSSNFRDIIRTHLKKMNSRKKVSYANPEKAKEIVNKNLTEQLAPISSRLDHYKFPMKLLIKKFEDILSN